MLRMMLLLVFSLVFVVHSANSAGDVEITGTGLILDDDTISYRKKYSYRFMRPSHIELNCMVSGAIGDHELKLEDDRGIGTRENFHFPWQFNTAHSVSHQFYLTPESRTISCTARNLHVISTDFKSTVDLKYGPDPTTTVPSISTTTKPTAPVPTKPTTGSAKPQTPATTKPTAPVPVEPTTGSAEPQTPGESVKNIVIACLCIVIVVVFFIVIIRNRCFRKRVDPNKMAENIMSRPPMDLPPEVVYEEVYSHGAGLQRPRRHQARGAAPQHQQ